MVKLKPCPVCGNRVDILVEYYGYYENRKKYIFSHHPAPFGFCILQATLDSKPFTKKRMENLARVWNIRGEDCHTIGTISEVEKVDIE